MSYLKQASASLLSPSLRRRLRGLAMFAAASTALAAPLGARAQDFLQFSYGASISSPPATNSQLGTPPWLLVDITNLDPGNQSGGVRMKISPFFQDTSTNPTTTYPDVFVSELAFNLIGAPLSVSYGGNCVSNEAAICTGFLTGANNGIFSGNGNQGVSGSAQTSGYDLLVNLPPPPGSAANVLNDGNFIEFDLTGVGVDAFLKQTANPGNNYTVAKVQGLAGNPGSTVISGEPGGDPPIDPETQVPGPLPILGGASAWAFSRHLRRRVQSGRSALAAVGSV